MLRDTLVRKEHAKKSRFILKNDTWTLESEATYLINTIMRSLIIVLVSAAAAQAFLIAPSRPVFSPASALRATTCVAQLTDSAGTPIKAALSSYMHFCQERRPGLTVELKAQHGEAFKQPLVMSTLGAEWKAIGAADKARFEAAAVADKQRYDAAVASNPANANVKGPKRKKAARSGPKKLSAYIHFCNERRESVTASLKASMGADFKYSAVMSALGAEWKTVDAASKSRFEEMAKLPVPE